MITRVRKGFSQQPVKSVTHLLSFTVRRSRPHSPEAEVRVKASCENDGISHGIVDSCCLGRHVDSDPSGAEMHGNVTTISCGI